MGKKLKHIIENELNWVQEVNEYDNFFNWFRTRNGPSRWIGRDLQWWMDHTQDVEYSMSAIHMDISEMLKYTDKISDGKTDAQTTLENLGLIGEFVIPTHGRNDIERYIIDIQNFTKEFRQYFGENTTLGDMVESVSHLLMYAQENNIQIKQNTNESVINEDFDWMINDTVSFLEIGEPLIVQSPKNIYRLHMTHGVGDGFSTWIPNWNDYDPTSEIDELIRHIKTLNYLRLNHDDGIWGLAGLWLDGKTWMLSDQDNKNIKKGMSDNEWTVEEDGDNIRDIVQELLEEELDDYGIRESDSYHQSDASIEEWKVTYFDEFGVEHSVKVNLE